MKNIILCSDGTGNKGGSGDDSNVFKLYNAIDLRPLEKDGETIPYSDNNGEREQITFYDNGVGTQDNSVISSLSGAFGLGFRRNVRDVYEFLARNYDPGDIIYCFGFSRGAATARAFAGMLQWCGLLDRSDFQVHEGLIDEKRFQKAIDAAMAHYEESAPPACQPGHYAPTWISHTVVEGVGMAYMKKMEKKNITKYMLMAR